MERPLYCQGCRRWFEGALECAGCLSLGRLVSTSWNYWWWAIMAQVHGMLQSTFRERRGVVMLLGVPPEVGFALMRRFAKPSPAINKKPIYDETHPSWKQGTSKGGTYHFIQFAYDNTDHVRAAFPLGEFYPKTCVDAVRLVTKRRLSDLRWWGTPVMFKYRWPAQKKLGVPTMGIHTFSIKANIGHAGLTDGLPRWNMEYARWVAEQQQ